MIGIPAKSESDESSSGSLAACGRGTTGSLSESEAAKRAFKFLH